ncbi:hypothetical protein K402DRAFT_399970 [Aulographum hederae CBS 113979]|uniref:UspA domain-containing protein n=1 Tax=Aulographum hederae CBS 113979 TaxID=1176131 RepID=A0A6G1HFV9_9PEZI|nr:hypothetical protein K402DRAFT_399970 [Aulographum hederae CBS 113979]
MSLESALDEERLEVMALLEGRSGSSQRRAPSSAPTDRSGSPQPQSPIRSMLDVANGSGRRKDAPENITTDPTSPNSVYTTASSTAMSPRRMNHSPTTSKVNPESAYQFEMLPSIEAHAMPKRNTLGGKKDAEKPKSSLAGIFGPSKSSKGRSSSTAEALKSGRTSSPSTRLGRSVSPGMGLIRANNNLMTDPKKFHSESGKVIDMNSAYRRLSDAALLNSGGSLAQLPGKRGSDPEKGESSAPDGGTRLDKDYYADDDALASSDESGQNSGEDKKDPDKRRGRRRTRHKPARATTDSPAFSDTSVTRAPRSLLAAAEEERHKVSASSQKYRSLLEPTVTVTSPEGEKVVPKKAGVHPNTNFYEADSGISSTMNSDNSDMEADLSDIQRAQRMACNVSAVHSTPEAHRCVRQIIRGEYSNFQKEAEAGLRRQRMYLVATDVSDEAAYALEWTIGTVLRDGDTLLAVYAVDEEVGTGGDSSGIAIGEGASMMQQTLSVVQNLDVKEAKDTGLSPGPSPLRRSFVDQDAPDIGNMDKFERERYHAALEVSDRCVKLLRKTRLQVRVVVEIFHCKSPKHMITEVIDFLQPTLVILGSRGRSALKGVLLGSFSNYLVTKSSVPVMVARKRLRKHSKYKRTNLRLSNVLTNPTGRLAAAKID